MDLFGADEGGSTSTHSPEMFAPVQSHGIPDLQEAAASAMKVAERDAQAGMGQALGSALRADPEWANKAITFIREFSLKTEHFISEDVSDASREAAMSQPPTDRSWGSIYRRAIKEGIIEMDGNGRSRRRHGSICPRWRSLIFRTPCGSLDVLTAGQDGHPQSSPSEAS